MTKRTINIYGARQNNLKNISLKIPKHKIVVFTGVSGSGKSSLVFETIGAEAQRQINETQDSFVRNRLQHFGVTDVDKIENLNVPVIINQKPLTNGQYSLNCCNNYRYLCQSSLVIFTYG
ncbi:excinuclease ABC, A subunit [Acinetobacter baumannii]|nr:excinuclease ABC, A subunit [Acinetobacter baumannii]